MGILKSLLRIVLGVIIGIGIFIGMAFGGAFLFRHFPGITAFILCCLIGILIVWKIIYCLRSGKVDMRGRWGRYVYEPESIEFWFYILFFEFIGFFSFYGGFYCLFHLPK